MTPDLSPQAPRLSRSQIAVLIVILAAAVFFRFSQISSASLWMDEIWTLEMSMGHGSLHDQLPANVLQTTNPNLIDLSHAAPWWQIWTHMDAYAHPPLYYILLRWWMDLFGASALAARALSAIFSLASILILFDICRILATTRFALLAAAIMTCSIAQIDAAQDARNYTMALFLTLAAADALARIEVFSCTPRRFAALILFSTAALLTHYFTASAIAALSLYSLIRLRGSSRIRTFAALALSVALFLASWGYRMHRQFHAMPPGIPAFLAEPPDGHARMTFFRIIGLPARYLFGESLARAMPPSPILIAAALVYIPPLLRLRRDRHSLLWLLLMIGVIGSAVASDLLRGSILLEYIRYTIVASPAVYAILAATNWPHRPVLADTVPILAIVLLLIFACQRAASPVPAKEDWRDLADQLNASGRPDDLLIFTSRDPWLTPGTWYLGLQYYTPNFNHPWLILNTPATPNLLRTLAVRDHVWLIGRRPERHAAQLLPGWEPSAVITTSAGGACLLVRP